MELNRRHRYKQSEKCRLENYRCFSFPANDFNWLMTTFYWLVLYSQVFKLLTEVRPQRAPESPPPSERPGHMRKVVSLPSGRAVVGSSAVNSSGRWWVLWVCRVHRTGCRWCSGTGPQGRAGSGRWNMWNTGVARQRSDDNQVWRP